MTETGFYAMNTWGVEGGRVAAIARHIPDAVVYVVGRSAARDLYGYHKIQTVVPTCRVPNCSGLSPRELARWLHARNPERLVMDITPYGVVNNEARAYLKTRGGPTFLLRRQSDIPFDFDANHFATVIDTEPDLDDRGLDLHPILAFDPIEILQRDAARNVLGAGDRPLVLIIGRGTTPEYVEFVIRCCEQRGINHAVIDTYPVMPLMAGADLIVGYSGYSQIEAAAVGTPMKAIASTADYRQQGKANTNATDLADTIANLTVRDPGPVSFTNRARRAAALIAGHHDWEQVDG